MRCTNCDYPLWNLTARECPECGRPFRPSEFEFVAGTVQFCCPHCEQVYYGTSEQGRLQPVEFDCVRCGNHIHMDRMLLRPTAGLNERDTQVESIPWLERKRTGFFKGWIATVWKSHIQPQRLMRALPDHSAPGQAWWFMLLTLFISTFLVLGGWIFFFAAVVLMVGGPFPMMSLGAPAFLGALGIGWVVAAALLVAIWGLTAHGLLRLTGPTHGTIGRTYSAICFASGPFMLAVIPCFGAYVAMPWWVAGSILAVSAAQQVAGWRATLAVVAMPVLTLIIVAGAYWYLMFYTVPTFQGGIAAGQTSARLSIIQQRIIAQGYTTQGQGPRHSAELIDSTTLRASQFIMPGTLSQATATPIGDTTLFDLDRADARRMEKSIQVAIDDLPENVIAHRLGDFVFTYHGLDVRTADPNLWLFITCADPDQNTTASIDEQYSIGTVGRGIRTIRALELDSELAEQNRLRESLGLPHLPDPWRVRHGQAVVEEPADDAADDES